MNSIKKILLFFASSLMIGNITQAQCNGSNSPTFQVTTSTVPLAINGFCGVQISIVNANTTPPGGILSYSIIAPGQSTAITIPTTIATVAGIWILGVMDINNFCVTSQTLQVNLFPAPNIVIAVSNTLICSGDSAILTASGANSYTWNTGATISSISVTPLNTLTYSVSGTGNNGCTNSSTAVINVNPLPNLTVTANQNPICASESVTLTANGSNTYTWSTLQTSSVLIVTPTITTTYNVSGTNEYACRSNAYVLVTVLPCTSVGELKIENEDLKIYPIPASDYVELEIANQEWMKDFTKLAIHSNLGLKIREEEITFESKSVKINTNDLSAGIYFLVISNAQNETGTKKLLIAK